MPTNTLLDSIPYAFLCHVLLLPHSVRPNMVHALPSLLSCLLPYYSFTCICSPYLYHCTNITLSSASRLLYTIATHYHRIHRAHCLLFHVITRHSACNHHYGACCGCTFCKTAALVGSSGTTLLYRGYGYRAAFVPGHATALLPSSPARQPFLLDFRGMNAAWFIAGEQYSCGLCPQLDP